MVNDKNNTLKGNPISLDMVKNAEFVKCDCGGRVFNERMMFKKISKLISPSGKEENIPIPVLICKDCNKVPRFFDTQDIIPEELKTIKK